MVLLQLKLLQDDYSEQYQIRSVDFSCIFKVSLAMLISDEARGLRGYHLSRLNKSDNHLFPYRLAIY